MTESNDPLLMNHEADGIRELDNLLPRWWVWLFYGSVIFGVIYMVYYHVTPPGEVAREGQMRAEYLAEMKTGDALKQAALGRFEAEIDAKQPSTDKAVLDQGKASFTLLCAPCHRPDGGGLVGPNLTDDYWIHGPKFSDNLKTIWNGIPEKGMVTWKGTLKPAEIYAVASYIYTLRGTKPENPKPPENLAPVKTGPSEFE